MTKTEDQKNDQEQEITEKEWRFLNVWHEPESRAKKRQLQVIDGLRKKYPPGSKAQNTLDVFDPRTGLADRNVDIANQALEALKSGDIQKADELMGQLTDHF